MVTKPKNITMPFAQKGLKNNIPEERDSSNPGQASLAEGFPAATMLPINQGGVPPSGRDMNGILNLLAQHIQYLNAGGTYTFDGNFAVKMVAIQWAPFCKLKIK
ncbi:MAG: hypothetical protein ACRCVY_06880, partial [Commensalibacter sp.]